MLSLSALFRPVLHRAALALMTALACLLAAPGMAGSLQVSPILVEFASGQQAQGLWLSNTGPEPIRAQVRVLAWTQDAGTETLTATRALMASPPILEIAPGQQQLVRVVRPQAAPLAQEQAYRLLVDELPGPDDQAPGLQLLLRYSVPVFLLPEGAVPAMERTGPRKPADRSALTGDVRRHGDQLQLTLHNHGPQRIRLSQLAYVAPDGRHSDLTPGLLGYVLAGQQMRWTLPLPTGFKDGGEFKARLDDDVDPQALPLRQDAGR